MKPPEMKKLEIAKPPAAPSAGGFDRAISVTRTAANTAPSTPAAPSVPQTDTPAPSAPGTTPGYSRRDDSAIGGLNAALRSDSPLMELARTEGIQFANRRGLANSSMAAGASQDAMVRNISPFVLQDSSNANSENIAQSQIASNERNLLTELGSRERLQAAQIAADKANLGLQLDSNEKIAFAEMAAAKERLGMELSVREKIALADNATSVQVAGIGASAQMAIAKLNNTADTQRLLMSLSAQERMQVTDNLAARDRLGLELTSRERVALQELQAADTRQQRDIDAAATRQAELIAADRATQERGITANTAAQQRDIDAAAARQSQALGASSAEAALDRTLQTQLASWNLGSSERQAAAGMLVNMQTFRSNEIQSIMSNTNLTAEQRTTQLAAAQTRFDIQMDLVRQMYDIELDWGQPAAPAAA